MEFPKLYCQDCHKFTESAEPILLRKVVDNFQVLCLCKNCSSTKCKFFSQGQRLRMPKDFYKMKDFLVYIGIFKVDGKIINFYDELSKILCRTN